MPNLGGMADLWMPKPRFICFQLSQNILVPWFKWLQLIPRENCVFFWLVLPGKNPTQIYWTLKCFWTSHSHVTTSRFLTHNLRPSMVVPWCIPETTWWRPDAAHLSSKRCQSSSEKKYPMISWGSNLTARGNTFYIRFIWYLCITYKYIYIYICILYIYIYIR